MVAKDVRVRSASGLIFREHVVHYLPAVLLAQVHEVERDPDLAGNHLGHETVFLPFAVTVEGRAGIVPVLHEHGEHIIALPLQQKGGHAGIHSTGKSDAHFHNTGKVSQMMGFVQFLLTLAPNTETKDA